MSAWFENDKDMQDARARYKLLMLLRGLGLKSTYVGGATANAKVAIDDLCSLFEFLKEEIRSEKQNSDDGE